MNKKYIAFFAVVFIAALILIFSRFSGNRTNNDVSLQMAEAELRNLSLRVLATGIVKPMVGAEVKVGSRISGLVEKLYANVGDSVDRGQMIAQLEDSELKARYLQAQATERSARAAAEYSRVDLERQKTLWQENLVSRNQLDLAQKTHDMNLAQLLQAEANVKLAGVQLDYTRINAPIRGVVASVSTQEGETVAASFSAPTFVNIIDLERLEVWAYVDETDIGRIRVGQQASFTVDTYPDHAFSGEVTAIYPKAVIQDNVVNYVATLSIGQNVDALLRPEMTASVTLMIENRPDVLTIPLKALRREGGQRVVTVLNGDRREKRPVRTGFSADGFIEISDGLKQGESVLIVD